IFAHARFAVVAVDEQQVDLSAGRIGGSRIRGDQPDSSLEPVSAECLDQLAVEVGSGAALTCLEVVGVNDAIFDCRGEQKRAPTTKPSNLDHRSRVEITHEAVQV